jgi:hypothetical protein
MQNLKGQYDDSRAKDKRDMMDEVLLRQGLNHQPWEKTDH